MNDMQLDFGCGFSIEQSLPKVFLLIVDRVVKNGDERSAIHHRA